MWTENVGVFLMTLIVEADFLKSAMTILNLTFSIKNWKGKVQNDHFWWSRNRPLLWEASEIPPRLVIQSVHISGSFYLNFKDDFKKGNVYRNIFFRIFRSKFKIFFRWIFRKIKRLEARSHFVLPILEERIQKFVHTAEKWLVENREIFGHFPWLKTRRTCRRSFAAIWAARTLTKVPFSTAWRVLLGPFFVFCVGDVWRAETWFERCSDFLPFLFFLRNLNFLGLAAAVRRGNFFWVFR